jgi:hypothetical protein
VADTSENGWVVNLVTIQMENGKNSTIRNRVEKLGAVPRSCQL